ncbi:unnamed protein product [Alternaria alternata]
MSVEIKLDEVRVHRQSANIEQARQILSRINDTLNAMSDDDDEVIDHYYENAASADHNGRMSQTHLSRQKLLIMAKFQDGFAPNDRRQFETSKGPKKCSGDLGKCSEVAIVHRAGG